MRSIHSIFPAIVFCSSFADPLQMLRPKRLTMRAALFVTIAVWTSTFFAGAVRAEGAGACSNYTDRALTQGQKASALKCGFSADHPAWSTDRNLHIRWCRGAKAESVRYQQGLRDSLVSNCEGCKAYAREADRAARENVAFRCGFEGPRWGFGDGGPNDGHYLWCMGGTVGWESGGLLTSGRVKHTSPAEVGASENAAREAALKNCRAKIKDRFTIEERRPCIEYAREARIQAFENQRNWCGAKQVHRWSTNEREHFEACIFVGESGKAFLAEEAEIRRKGLEACEKGYLLSHDGYSTGRKGKEPPPAWMTPRRYSGGDTTSTNPGTSKSSSTGKGNSPISGGCGSSAMDRLGGGGCGPSGRAAGGDNLSHSSGTPGTKGKPGGAAVITPMAPTSSPAGTNKSFTRSPGGPSGGETKAYQGGTPVAAPEPKKFGRSNSSVDYGFGPKPAAPKPPYVR